MILPFLIASLAIGFTFLLKHGNFFKEYPQSAREYVTLRRAMMAHSWIDIIQIAFDFLFIYSVFEIQDELESGYSNAVMISVFAVFVGLRVISNDFWSSTRTRQWTEDATVRRGVWKMLACIIFGIISLFAALSLAGYVFYGHTFVEIWIRRTLISVFIGYPVIVVANLVIAVIIVWAAPRGSNKGQ